jgi:hypothetical protein
LKRLLIILVFLLAKGGYAQQGCDAGITFSPPITISAGGTYSGNWQSTNPSIPAVTITATTPVTIINSRLKGPGDILTAMWNNQVTIQNDCFVGTNPNVYGAGKGSPVRIQNPTVAIVEHNDFESTGGNGISIQEYWGNFNATNPVRVRYNRFRNIDGRYSNGADGYLTNVNGEYSHAVIFSLVKHVPGMEISWNQIINVAGQSQDTDSINVFSSSGVPASPLLVHDNYVQGQYAANPANPDGLSYSGTGIVTDDQEGITDPANATSYVNIFSNQVVSIALAGISISAGNNNTSYGNRVVSSGQLADGTNISSVNAAGVGTNNYLKEPSGVYGNNSVHDNFSGVRRTRSSGWNRQDYYFGVPVTTFNNASLQPATSTSPAVADEQAEFSRWSAKLFANGITVGSTLLTAPACSATQ